MPRVIRLALLAAAVVPTGCDQAKKDATPNPSLQVPDVPAGGHGSKGAMKDPGKKK